MKARTVLQAHDISKWYGSVGALKHIDFEMTEGQIWALVGENGAGKSTLARILSGVETADDGSITGEKSVAFVPQIPALAPGLTMLDNLIVGHEPTAGPFLARRAARAKVDSVARAVNLHINLDQKAANATAGEIRFAALVAQLLREPSVLILDEPSVGMDTRSRERMHETIRKLAQQGMAILLISHDLGEVHDLACGVTVLREGRSVATFSSPHTSGEVADAMFADSVSALPRKELCVSPEIGENRLLIDGLTAISPSTGMQIGPIDLAVHAGERIAVLGLREDGIEMVESLLSGTLWITSGIFALGDERLPARFSPAFLRSAGLSYVPSDRIAQSATLRGSVEENLILHERKRLHTGGFFRADQSARFANNLLSRFKVDGNRAARLASLSGGNIQRVILSRELSWNPSVVVIAEPAAGLDLKGQTQLADELRSLASSGTAVVVLGSDLQEAELFADRVVVMHAGRMAGSFDHGDQRKIVRAMMGIGTQ